MNDVVHVLRFYFYRCHKILVGGLFNVIFVKPQ